MEVSLLKEILLKDKDERTASEVKKVYKIMLVCNFIYFYNHFTKLSGKYRNMVSPKNILNNVTIIKKKYLNIAGIYHVINFRRKTEFMKVTLLM
jgi:hypothetical protein